MTYPSNKRSSIFEREAERRVEIERRGMALSFGLMDQVEAKYDMIG